MKRVFILLIIFISIINASQSIICKIEDGFDINKIANRVNIDIEYIKDLGSNLYIIGFDSNKTAKMISEEFKEQDGIIYAQPNETKKVIKR